MAMTVGMAACSDAPTTPASRANPSTVLSQVVLEPQAAVMAEGATLQLQIHAIALDQTSIASYDTVTFVSTDSTRVKVSNSGLITAATGPTAETEFPVAVVASVQKNGVTQTDTAYIAVVATAGTSPTFSIRASDDTVPVAIGDTKTVYPTVTYMVGGMTVTMDPFTVPFKIRLNPADAGSLQGPTSFMANHATGSATVYGTTSIFGATLTDSTTYRFGDPSNLFLFVEQNSLIFFQGSGTVGADTSAVFYLRTGGTVTFQNNLFQGDYVVGVSFTASNGGVAPPPQSGLGGFGRATLTFNVPGTYVYRWTGDAATVLPPNQLGSTIVVR